jgi:predicted transposase YdaD
MKALKDKLANSPELMEDLSDNPFYVDWVGIGEKKGKAEGKAEAREEAVTQLMQNIGMTLDQAMNALSFNDAERKAFNARFNGHGSNGNGKA